MISWNKRRTRSHTWFFEATVKCFLLVQSTCSGKLNWLLLKWKCSSGARGLYQTLVFQCLCPSKEAETCSKFYGFWFKMSQRPPHVACRDSRCIMHTWSGWSKCEVKAYSRTTAKHKGTRNTLILLLLHHSPLFRPHIHSSSQLWKHWHFLQPLPRLSVRQRGHQCHKEEEREFDNSPTSTNFRTSYIDIWITSLNGLHQLL